MQQEINKVLEVDNLAEQSAESKLKSVTFS